MKPQNKNTETKSGSIAIGIVIGIAVIGGAILAFKTINALFRISWQASEEVVSGIVYDAHFNDWPGNNTTFKVRASAEMAVTEDTSATFCLPEGSEYESIVREAAENKDVKVIVKVNKTPLHLREKVFKCDDNIEVAKK